MNGILLVNKPVGPTSHDIVDFVRSHFNIKKVGHAGTLDPFAEGLLVLLLGDCTKRQSEFMGSDKEYIVNMRLGISTDTGDRLGKVVFESSGILPDYDTLKGVLKEFIGVIKQDIPAYSAAKFKGTPLYKFARRNINLVLPPKIVEIKSIDILKFDKPNAELLICCSKGTYIRQLCHDIGKRLATGAHAFSLIRIASGRFRLEDAVGLEMLKEADIDSFAKLVLEYEPQRT